MIFPELVGKKFGLIDLNSYAVDWLSKNPQKCLGVVNPFFDQDLCQRVVDELAQNLGVDFTYGGYMEMRDTLFKGTPGDNYQHLGVDFFVPAGTQIAADVEAKVVLVDDDFAIGGGWGPRVIINPADGTDVLLYAHLDRNIKVRAGDVLQPGQVFASVGKIPYNGGWLPHLHIQAIRGALFDELRKAGIINLDGYATPREISEMRADFPDPMRYVKLG